MKTGKSILDVIREAVCPNCGMQMKYHDLGEAPSVCYGGYDGHDYGGVWICKCGYRSDE